MIKSTFVVIVILSTAYHRTCFREYFVVNVKMMELDKDKR